MRPETPETPRLEPCAEINPALWGYFCQLAGRGPEPSDLWTEADVVQWLDEKEAVWKANHAFHAFQAMGAARR
jgi:hypothetical protein